MARVCAVVKLSLVTETFPPEVNGVAMTLHRLCSSLAARGHAVEVIRPRQGKRDTAAVAPFTEFLVPGFPCPGYRELTLGWPVYFRLKQHWRAARPDLVHIAVEGPLGFAALLAARSLELPISSSFHTNFHAYSRHYHVGFLRHAGLAYFRWFHNRTACTFAPSVDVIAALEASGFRNMHFMGRGVDVNMFNPAKRDDALRASWGAQPETPVAICVGRLAAEKNLPLVVEAWAQLRHALPDLKLVLVGDGPMRSSLARKFPETHFAGVRRGEDLARHYASGDLFLFASVTETFGNVVTEALASGLTVVAYDYAAARAHVRDGENGFLAGFDDPAAYCAAAARAASLRSAWPQLRAAARATALNLSWDRVVDDFENTLQGLIPQPVNGVCVTAG
jgi:glycosyltransferase involved in cell wall biosynthesis